MGKYSYTPLTTQYASEQGNAVKAPSDANGRDKLVSMLVLSFMAALIILSGTAYSFYSYFNKTSFHVLNTDLPGFILGLVAVFLGARYMKSVIEFRKKLIASGASFSWKNFKKTKEG